MSTVTPARITGRKTTDKSGAEIPGLAKALSKPAEAPAEVKPDTVVLPADPWATVMESAVIAPAFVRGPRVVNVTVPESIKVVLEHSLTEWGQEISDPNGNALGIGTAKFRILNAGTVTRAKEFVAFAKAWARDRENGQVSVRAFLVKEGKNETATVKFAAMPLVKNETRAMTAANGASSADVRKWAQENGITVPDRGKLKPEVFSAYNAANPAGDPNQTTIDEA